MALTSELEVLAQAKKKPRAKPPINTAWNNQGWRRKSNEIRHFGAQQKIFFVHFRDVDGTPEKFEETWHDAGPTDMLACLRAYREVGFDGLMRPDHVPTVAGDSNEEPGYSSYGRLFALGYIRGLLHASAEPSPNSAQ